jgi:hypothetical protein
MYQRISDAYRVRRIQYRQSRIQCLSGRLWSDSPSQAPVPPLFAGKNGMPDLTALVSKSASVADDEPLSKRLMMQANGAIAGSA